MSKRVVFCTLATKRAGTAKQWISAFEQASAEQRWVILPTWQPQYLNQAYSIRQLEDPQQVLGGENRGTLIATRDFLNQLPARTREVLQRIRLDIAAVTEMDYMVNVEGKTPREAAQKWMKANASRVSSWMTK